MCVNDNCWRKKKICAGVVTIANRIICGAATITTHEGRFEEIKGLSYIQITGRTFQTMGTSSATQGQCVLNGKKIQCRGQYAWNRMSKRQGSRLRQGRKTLEATRTLDFPHYEMETLEGFENSGGDII